MQGDTLDDKVGQIEQNNKRLPMSEAHPKAYLQAVVVSQNSG